eukprot:TRINITY_DN64512_c0_g1_i1.p4 TRINITY_DN64512_c0_g1~~TRINITY_DN64512_c0_g1_i1.p4  ORF type:complete len:105 (-),score=13.90 TRINITY_DN64512_c0_g1_i1:292-606(-)
MIRAILALTLVFTVSAFVDLSNIGVGGLFSNADFGSFGQNTEDAFEFPTTFTTTEDVSTFPSGFSQILSGLPSLSSVFNYGGRKGSFEATVEDNLADSLDSILA